MWVFGAVAFGLPRTLAENFAPTDRVSYFLDAALYFQVIGYVLAVLLAIYLVRNVQGNDWSTLGLAWRGNILQEVTAGIGFGLLLLGAWLPISYLLAGGEFELDGLVRLLVGSTSGVGLALAATVVVIGAPLIEEIYYRGLLYEKLARRNIWLAIAVTTVLFTAAHGALLIPAIMLMGLALAWRRQTKSLWYTMGAHAAWNLMILALGLTVFSGGWTFTPSDNAYSIALPKAWERIDQATLTAPGIPLDIAMQSATGSVIGILRLPAVNNSAHATTLKLQRKVEQMAPPGLIVGSIQGHDHLFDGGAEAFHLPLGIEMDGVQVASHFFLMLKPGAQQAIVFNIVCPRVSCHDDGGKLDEAMHDLVFDI